MTFVSHWILRVVFEYSLKALDVVIGQVLFWLLKSILGFVAEGLKTEESTLNTLKFRDY